MRHVGDLAEQLLLKAVRGGALSTLDGDALAATCFNMAVRLRALMEQWVKETSEEKPKYRDREIDEEMEAEIKRYARTSGINEEVVLCNAISRRLGVELTLEEAERLLAEVEEEQEPDE